MIFLQAPPFLPDELTEWVSAGVLLGGFLVTLWRIWQANQKERTKFESEMTSKLSVLSERVERGFEGQGSRIEGVYGGCAGLKSEWESVKLTHVQQSYMIDTNTREATRCTTEIKDAKAVVERLEENLQNFRERTVDRLARVEAVQGIPRKED